MIPSLPIRVTLPYTTGLPLWVTLPVTSVFDGPHPAVRPPSARNRATSPDRRGAGRASARMDGLLCVRWSHRGGRSRPGEADGRPNHCSCTVSPPLMLDIWNTVVVAAL